MRMFDIPDAAESCTRRIRSNTPLQALTLLNDPWFVEFSVALADRTLREKPDATDAQKIVHAFGLCLARSPKPTELKMLTELVDRQRKSLQEEPHRTKELTRFDRSGNVQLKPGTGHMDCHIACLAEPRRIYYPRISYSP
jgi:hypothetical protein